MIAYYATTPKTPLEGIFSKGQAKKENWCSRCSLSIYYVIYYVIYQDVVRCSKADDFQDFEIQSHFYPYKRESVTL